MRETETLPADGWIDVTRPMVPGMPHWPGDPEFEIERVSDMSRGDRCNVSRITLCTHTGTHMDSPLHYIADGVGMDAAPLAAMLGPARVLECDDPIAIRRPWLEQQGLRQGERIIFKTRQPKPATAQLTPPTGFREDYVYIGFDAAQLLAEKETLFVGIDTMSVGGYYDSMVDTHVALLSGGCWLVENLDLENITAGNYEIICLPVNIINADGAPARVLMRKI